jgi:HK97 family phage portal protein
LGLYSFLKSWFTPEGNLNDPIFVDLAVEYHYKKLAINTCVNLIANTLVRAKIRTFENGKEIKGNNHYLFNVQPNQNQNSSAFFHEFVSKLVYENECLVIMQNGQLYVADSFEVKKYAFHENVYSKIVVNHYRLNKTFLESEVLFYELNNEKIKSVIDSLFESYGKLLTASINYYKRSNALRVLLRTKGARSQKTEEQKKLEDMFNEQLKKFMTSDSSAVLPLQDGINLEELQSISNSGRTSRDIRAIVDDIFDFISIAFHIPKGLLKGDVADVEGQTDNFLMFCIAPIAEIIEDECNRKFYTKEEYLKRTYLKVDTRLIKYVDIVKLANALDKLLSSGTHSVNENRSLIDSEPLEDEWANEHFVTKNYEEIKEYLKGGEGE